MQMQNLKFPVIKAYINAQQWLIAVDNGFIANAPKIRV